MYCVSLVLVVLSCPTSAITDSTDVVFFLSSMENSDANFSNNLFSDEEPADISTDRNRSPMTARTQRPMDSDLVEGNSSDTLFRPLNASGTQQQVSSRKRVLTSEVDSSDEDGISHENEGLQEIKGLLQLFFKKYIKRKGINGTSGHATDKVCYNFLLLLYGNCNVYSDTPRSSSSESHCTPKRRNISPAVRVSTMSCLKFICV